MTKRILNISLILLFTVTFFSCNKEIIEPVNNKATCDFYQEDNDVDSFTRSSEDRDIITLDGDNSSTTDTDLNTDFTESDEDADTDDSDNLDNITDPDDEEDFDDPEEDNSK